jgi:hypothetical protein|tara:strand:+ start:373 stop:684 length:312 start_codon:yes stop_codon:yes gene_type:complete
MTEKTELQQQFAGLDLKTDMGVQAMKLALKFVKVLDEKQQDYGPDNITISGELGVIVRSQDKLCRLKHLLGKETVNNESVSDSWMDLANYGLIGYMVHNGKWS